MQTITTKYLSATNTKGARIKATHTGDYTSVTEGYDYSLNSADNYCKVAELLAKNLIGKVLILAVIQKKE